MGNCIVERLHEILMQERKVIFGGHFEKMDEIFTAKESLLKQLPSQDLSKVQIEKIAVNVARNQSIIEAAISGIKSSQKHILAQIAPTQNSAFYNRNGILEFHNNSTLRVVRTYL